MHSRTVGEHVIGRFGESDTLAQVPQFLYEAGYGSERFPERAGQIGVTQPRRVAAIAAARRVAEELGCTVGGTVGYQASSLALLLLSWTGPDSSRVSQHKYLHDNLLAGAGLGSSADCSPSQLMILADADMMQVRYDRQVGQDTAVKFMTDGILLRELQSDLLLRSYSVLVLDEAHERSLNTDLLLGEPRSLAVQMQRLQAFVMSTRAAVMLLIETDDIDCDFNRIFP